MLRSATICLLSLISFTAFAAEPMTPQSIRKLFQETNAIEAVNMLAKDGRLDRIYDLIGKGRTDWLALVPIIKPGTDAATSESLGVSLAYALPRNPAAVLTVLRDDDSSIGIHWVCSAPFIEPTEKMLTQYRRAASRALITIQSDANGKMARKCLANLRKSASATGKKP